MKCKICNNDIPTERVEAIQSLNLDELCYACAAQVVRPMSGIYPGFSGQEMILTDKLSKEEGIPKPEDNIPPKYDYEEED